MKVKLELQAIFLVQTVGDDISLCYGNLWCLKVNDASY